jgi:hypothetical protein
MRPLAHLEFAVYVGEYQLKPGLILTISKQDDQLFGQVPWGMKLEIFLYSETAFFVKGVRLNSFAIRILSTIRNKDYKTILCNLFYLTP